MKEKYKRPNALLSNERLDIITKGGKRFKNYYYLVRVISTGKITKMEEKELAKPDKSREIIEWEDYDRIMQETKIQCEVKAIRDKRIAVIEFQLKKPVLVGEDFTYVVRNRRNNSEIGYVKQEEAVKSYFGG